MVDSAHRKPSNVAVYFSVDTSKGEPMGGLEAENFEIYEDGSLVSLHESKQTIVNPELAAAHYTLLLVDMSGSVSETDQVPLIAEASREFVNELQRQQRVAVFAFDGSAKLYKIQDFAAGKRTERTLRRLKNFTTKDPSTNLHGAVVSALKELDKALDKAKEPLRFGTLVVFTDGTDRAARVSAYDADRAIANSELDIFAIGVGAEIDEGTLGRIGVNGYVLAQDSEALTLAFRTIGERVAAYTRRYYLLSYCSPARAGRHEVTIKVNGPEPHSPGKLQYSFDATGFGPRCNPKRPPPFDIRRQKLGTVRRGDAPRGLRIELKAQATVSAGGSVDVTDDPELGEVGPADPPPPPVPEGRSMEELENELPPGLQPEEDDDD